jgi:hypothetical protein
LDSRIEIEQHNFHSNLEPGQVKVISGSIDAYNGGNTHLVSEIIIHEEFGLAAGAGNDIAVWKVRIITQNSNKL